MSQIDAYEEGAPQMVDRAIAAISDGTTREACMALRTEFYRELTRTQRENVRIENVITKLTEATAAHIRASDEERGNSQQWRESFTRIIEKHSEADDHQFGTLNKRLDAQAESTAKQFGGWTKWLVGVLISVIGALVLSTVTLAVKLLGW